MGDTPDLARTRFALARALVASGGEHARAAELAELADRTFTATGHLNQERRQVTAWRRTHR